MTSAISRPKPDSRHRFTAAERIVFPLLLAVALFFAADAIRAPQNQVSVRLFRVAVAEYRAHLHPFTSRFIRCRFNPTCSAYALLAVERFGIAHGLRLAATRIWICRDSVPLGTYDPVPPAPSRPASGALQSK